MKSLSYITHPLYLEHYAGAVHPERAERLTAINNHIMTLDISEFIRFITPEPATLDHINLVHDMNYIDEVKYAYNNGRRILDIGDTVISEKSFDAALLAAGAVIGLTDMIGAETMRSLINEMPKKHLIETNLKALDEGLKSVKHFVATAKAGV